MRSSFAVFAALAAASLAATPLVMGASKAFATQDGTHAVQMPAVVTPIDVVTVPAPVQAETCTRKVRIVYAGYGGGNCAR
jgi:hypothetical protein